MAEKIKFYFDPGCPWCYVTSKWAKRLEELGVVDLSWGIFCLEIANAENSAEKNDLTGRSAAALRTAALVDRKEGTKAVGKYYSALGRRVWDEAKSLQDADVIKEALTEAGLDDSLYEQAQEDESTMQACVDSHRKIVQERQGFGVPTIVLDDGEGPALFGPVIYKVPPDDEAKELFEHAAWLTRNTNFAELKRTRTDTPDLEAIRIFRERRAQAQREQAQSSS